MKLQLRHFIAAPFLAFAGFVTVSLLRDLGRILQKDWGGICFMILMSLIMIFVSVVLGILALQRRWDEFVRIIATFVLFIGCGLLMRQTNDLNRAIESLAPAPTSFPFIVWGLCVTAAPFVICIVAYKRLVPLILRHIARSANTTVH